MLQPIFKQVTIIDPLTGKERVISEEEQEEMLEKGILIAPAKEKKEPEQHE